MDGALSPLRACGPSVAKGNRALARPREFDEESVLEAAMNCFWTRGYELTSIRNLADEMGLAGASIYNAFGDKRSLYKRALDRYLECSVHDRIDRLSQLPPVSAIRAFFDEIIERSVKDRQRRGCMLVNAALETTSQDPTLRAAVAREFGLLEAFFRRCVVAGQEDGTISARQPPEEVAAMLLSILLGLRVLARTGPQRSVLDGAVNGALGLLEAAS
jgi:TetR/AcrR family transcriptional repressor of nem operon